MNKLIFLAVSTLIFSACERHDINNEEYAFHDDFYYSYEGEKCYIEPCTDEYYILFKTEYQLNVIKALQDRDFQLVTTPSVLDFSLTDNFLIPKILKGCSSACIKGTGNVDNVPFVIYSNHLYYGKSGQSVGRSNILSVEYEIDSAEEQIQQMLQYATDHNIYPIGLYPEAGICLFACTNESSGNPIEISNWFVEKTQFKRARPEYETDKID